ncbi:hypothetical protein [Halopiger aswanensis]|uniref:Uncharacterized protein n=1 Tax=Halopiger aswanensis TaxID=148449 RepID=A0A3R7HUW7_9EURY|nr:hypothetical protein [Halopiger aswanensis]RKD85242.1 hypothetical protein ATJ93_4747 [Halopiger aswanensis]
MADPEPEHPTCERCDSLIFATSNKVVNVETGETAEVRLCDSCIDELHEEYGIGFDNTDPIADVIDDG